MKLLRFILIALTSSVSAISFAEPPVSDGAVGEVPILDFKYYFCEFAEANRHYVLFLAPSKDEHGKLDGTYNASVVRWNRHTARSIPLVRTKMKIGKLEKPDGNFMLVLNGGDGDMISSGDAPIIIKEGKSGVEARITASEVPFLKCAVRPLTEQDVKP